MKKFVVLLLCISVAAGTYITAELQGASSLANAWANEVTTENQGLIAGKQEGRATNHDEHEVKYQAALNRVAATEALIVKLDDVHERATKKIASFKDIIFSLKEGIASLGEESGTGVQWFGTGTGQDHSGVNCKDSPDCNPAKCYGNTQNNTAKYGDLDCESEPTDGLDKHKGSHCLDNLSNAQFYVSTAEGEGKCVDFSSNEAYSRKTFFTQTDPAGQLRDGVISKLTVTSVDPEMMVEHSRSITPGGTHTGSHRKRYGIISGKRMVCTDSICHVFKVGMCIKCPEKSTPFARRVGLNTLSHIDEFVKCCVMGGKDKDGNVVKTCDDHYTHADGSGAFTARNNAGATLKDEYQCWDGTDADVDGKFAETQAHGIIKAS